MLFNQFDPNDERPFGRPNPSAPSELALFAFMIGEFDCVDHLLTADGSWREMKATWHTHYTLNGYAIQDNYRNEIYAGMSIRSYISPKNEWVVKFFGMPGGHTGLWKGGQVDDKIVLISKQTDASGSPVTSRLSFSQITADSFEWLAEKVAEDGVATPNWRISAKRRR